MGVSTQSQPRTGWVGWLVGRAPPGVPGTVLQGGDVLLVFSAPGSLKDVVARFGLPDPESAG